MIDKFRVFLTEIMLKKYFVADNSLTNNFQSVFGKVFWLIIYEILIKKL